MPYKFDEHRRRARLLSLVDYWLCGGIIYNEARERQSMLTAAARIVPREPRGLV